MTTSVRIAGGFDNGVLGAPMYLSSLASATAIQIVGHGALPTSATAMRWSTPKASGAIPVRIVGYGGAAGAVTPVPSQWSTADASANSFTLSNGGMTYATGPAASNKTIRGTVSHTSGKVYVEFFANNTGGNLRVGLASAGFDATGQLGATSFSCGTDYGFNAVSAGFTSNYGTLSYPGPAITVCMAVDFAAGSIWIAMRNQTWENGSNPATGSLPIFSFTPATVGALFPAIEEHNVNTSWTLQPTATSQTYAPPAGFSAWG